MRALLSVFVLLLIAASAHAQVKRGNDAVTLWVGNEFEAHLIATEFCARGDKYTIIRVHGRSGDEIAINCLAAPPAPRSTSIRPAQPATNQITELSTQFRQMLASLSADLEGATNAIGELPAQFSRALGTFSTAVQPEMPKGEKKPPKASGRTLAQGEKERPKPPGRALVDSSAKNTDAPVLVDTSSTYAQVQ